MSDSLPLEILYEIAKSAQFSREELLACRLVSRRFCVVFTPSAFRTVRTNSFDRISFDRLCWIAQSPHLAKHVLEYEYRPVPILAPVNHNGVDNLLASLSFVEPGGNGGQPTAVPWNSQSDNQSENMDLVAYARQLHQDHQKYLHQQDVLGTFYDTLSMMQSLPLFNKLQTIRILDFAVPPKDFDIDDPTNKEAYNITHITAVVRAFNNITKILRFLRTSALPELRCWEIERFDYEVFNSHRDSTCDHIDVQQQFRLALYRVPILKIHKLTNGNVEPEFPRSLAPYSLADELMSGDDVLEELTLSDGRGTDAPRHYRYTEVTFPWGPSSELPRFLPINHTDNGRFNGSLFPNLRKLDLSGHRSLDLINFARMLVFLTPGVLKELALESLGMVNGQWEDLFRIIAPKKKWRKKIRPWHGAHIHATVQLFLFGAQWLQADLPALMGLVEDCRNLNGSCPRKPEMAGGGLWKGLRLRKCQLKHLCYWGDVMTDDGFQRFPLSAQQEETFRRWMMDGLDEEQYDALFLP